MALHALGYCERLFYLEEVEEIRIADEAVYAGRRLLEEIVADEGERESLLLESEALGLKGKVHCSVRDTIGQSNDLFVVGGMGTKTRDQAKSVDELPTSLNGLRDNPLESRSCI